MIFIGGLQPRTVRVEKQPGSCAVCAHQEVYLKRVDQYISLFFIPVIRIKKGTPFLQCENCDAAFDDSDSSTGSTARQSPGLCRSCGKLADTGFSYCPYCGKKL
jgi:zinc-ribbon family